MVRMIPVRRYLRRKRGKQRQRLPPIPPAGTPLFDWNEIAPGLLDEVLERAKGRTEKSWSILPDGNVETCEGGPTSCIVSQAAVYVFHTHPASPYDTESRPPSVRDVLSLYRHPMMKASIVVDGHGNVWGMRKTTETSTRSPWKLMRDYKGLEELFGSEMWSEKFARELGIEVVQLRSQWDPPAVSFWDDVGPNL